MVSKLNSLHFFVLFEKIFESFVVKNTLNHKTHKAKINTKNTKFIDPLTKKATQLNRLKDNKFIMYYFCLLAIRFNALPALNHSICAALKV